MSEGPKFEQPTTLEEENKLILTRSEYLLEQLGIDILTGLKNRSFFENELERALKAIRGRGEKHHRASDELLRDVSLIFVDLDNFKQVNDTHGHLVGDKVLKKVAKILTESVREADVVARFGGDEFYVLLPHAKEKKAEEIANKICENLKSNPELKKFKVTASLGVCAMNVSNVTNSEDLIHYADLAANMAKQSGKNQVKVYRGGDET